MKGTISKVKNNHKKPYEARGSKIYVHAVKFEGDDTPYEVHAKSETCKHKVGDTIEYEVTTDRFNNKKIKVGNYGGGSYSAGGSVQPPAPPSKGLIWATIFSGLCTLAQGKQTSTVIAKATDTLFAKVKDL